MALGSQEAGLEIFTMQLEDHCSQVVVKTTSLSSSAIIAPYLQVDGARLSYSGTELTDVLLVDSYDIIVEYENTLGQTG